ncbi:MAG: ADP-ribosylglycohydrolase family protein [Prolixibacteraceae bacterium]
MLGAIIGDIVGSRFEFTNHKSTEFELFHRDCQFTDDTICTIAVADWLCTTEPNPQRFADLLQQWCREYPNPMGGYGLKFKSWIREANPQPYGSFGNGSAMRIAPVGWAFNTVEETCMVAKQISEVTHNHPEGIKGAQAAAVAIFLARTGHSKQEIKQEITDRFGYNLNRTCREIQPVYLYNETCQGTVPEAIIAFMDGTDFESSIRLAVSLGGDSDTLTCITGSIAEAFYRIPYEIEKSAMNYLPEKITNVLSLFRKKFTSSLDDAKYFAQIRITPESTWNEMFRLIPILEQLESKELVKWHKSELQEDGSHTFPYPVYDEVVNQWIRAFYQGGLEIPYRWGDWLDARGFSNNWSEVDYSVLSVVDICKIFTAVNRAERFSDGAIGEFFQEGNMIKCLKVLKGRINQEQVN